MGQTRSLPADAMLAKFRVWGPATRRRTHLLSRCFIKGCDDRLAVDWHHSDVMARNQKWKSSKFFSKNAKGYMSFAVNVTSNSVWEALVQVRSNGFISLEKDVASCECSCDGIIIFKVIKNCWVCEHDKSVLCSSSKIRGTSKMAYVACHFGEYEPRVLWIDWPSPSQRRFHKTHKRYALTRFGWHHKVLKQGSWAHPRS